jgi:hypothetical protein
VRPDIRLRARIHRLFEFKDPLKSQVRILFPGFLTDEMYVSAPRGKPLPLTQLARCITQNEESPSWVSRAEGRPARLETRKRQLEAAAETRLKRGRFLHLELEARGLPVDEQSISFQDYVSGRCKAPTKTIEEMEKLKRERLTLARVNARDLSFQVYTPTPYTLTLFVIEQTIKLGIKFDPNMHVAQSKSGPRTVALAYLMEALPQDRNTDYLERQQNLRALERLTALEVGELMLNCGAGNLDNEVALWIEAARRTASRVLNSGED